MAQQEGPFSEYLQMAKMTPQVQVPQPTGLEGSGAAIGNIAMNFINGLRQGRMQKYAMQQMEEQKKFDAYQDAIKTVAASDLPDAEKQRLSTQLSMPLIQRIAGDKQATSKETGNPLTDVLKNMAVGLVGGQAPKKSMELPMDPVVEALRAASDPSRSRTRILSQLDGQARARISEILRTQPSADVKTFMSDPGLSEINAQVQQAFGPGAKLPSIERAYAEFRPMTEAERLATEAAKEKREAAKEYTGVPPTVPTAPVATAPVVAPEVKATGAIPAAQPQPTEAAPIEAFKPLPMDKLEQDRVLAIRAGFPTRESRGEPKMYLDQKTGETFQGFTTSGRSGFGIYRPDKQGIYSSGVRELSAAELAKPPQAQVDRVYNSTLESMKRNVRPKIFESFKGMLDSLREQGDIKSMENVLGKAIDKDTAESNLESKRQQIAEKAKDTGDLKKFNMIGALDRRIGQNVKVKNYETVYSYSDDALGAYERAKVSGAKENYSLADVMLVRSLAKLTDLTTGVKEGEYAIFANAVSKLGKLGITVSNLLESKGEILDKETRSKILEAIRAKRIQAAKNYNTEIGRYRSQGKSANLTDEEMDEMLPTQVPVEETTPPPGTGGGSRVPTRDEGASRGGGKTAQSSQENTAFDKLGTRRR